MSELALGILEADSDVGVVGIAGSASWDGSAYTVTGSGHNMWGDTDAFHFVWTKVEGDVTLSADVDFVGAGSELHRKACLVIRQNLEPGSPYADIALHGDGLTSLQYRDAPDTETREVCSDVTAGRHLEIRRSGDYVLASADGVPVGGAVRLELDEPYYLGLAVCSHSVETSESAVFQNVEIGRPVSEGKLVSFLEVLTVDSGERRTVRVFDQHIEAPNWTADDRLIFNSEGTLHSIAVTGGEVTPIDSAFADRCNNDHGLSPDGTRIAISDQSQDDHRSVIYTLPIEGGEPVRLTAQSPSYWHGWSPDGDTICFTGQRDGAFGIFTIPAGGGEETRLTTTSGLDDGPEYSPDGEWIYFNSDRSGLMQIYRMRPDGSELTRVTEDGFGNWFPHLSPDGTKMAYLAYRPEVSGHPADKDVDLKLLDLTTGVTRTVASLFGGQGTINVPSWSPDGTRFAFVSYLYV
jgi:WD40 repeat protein